MARGTRILGAQLEAGKMRGRFNGSRLASTRRSSAFTRGRRQNCKFLLPISSSYPSRLPIVKHRGFEVCGRGLVLNHQPLCACTPLLSWLNLWLGPNQDSPLAGCRPSSFKAARCFNSFPWFRPSRPHSRSRFRSPGSLPHFCNLHVKPASTFCFLDLWRVPIRSQHWSLSHQRRLCPRCLTRPALQGMPDRNAVSDGWHCSTASTNGPFSCEMQKYKKIGCSPRPPRPPLPNTALAASTCRFVPPRCRCIAQDGKTMSPPTGTAQ
jgi:hypothetical protein